MARMDWRTLLELDGSRPYIVASTEADLDASVVRLREAWHALGGNAYILRGERMGDKTSVFQEFAAALQFPYYFGGNWDALDECLGDLEWLTATRYALFLTRIDTVFGGNDPEFRTLASVLLNAMGPGSGHQEQGPRRPTPVTRFQVVFHSEPSEAKRSLLRLESAGVDADRV